MPTTIQMEDIVNRLQQLVAALPALLQQFSMEEMGRRPAPGKWSRREILGHLCDAALHNWQRFTSIQHQQVGPFVVVPYPQEPLVQLNGYQNQPTGQVAALWAALNTQIVAVLKNIPPEKLTLPVALPDGSPADLLFLAQDYLAHLEHHLRQMFPDGRMPTSPTLPGRWHISVADALEALAGHSAGKPFLTLLEYGKMYVEIYRPRGADLQTPHDQDEIYVVASGSGVFFNNGERRAFGTGDVLFVPAGVEHRFETFTEDFSTWVIFY